MCRAEEGQGAKLERRRIRRKVNITYAFFDWTTLRLIQSSA